MSTDPDDLRDHLEPGPGQLGLFDPPAVCPALSPLERPDEMTGRTVAWAVVVGDHEGGWLVTRVVPTRTRAIDIREDLIDGPESRPYVRLAAVVIEP